MGLTTEVIATAARLDAVGPAWDALWRQTGQGIFQSHGWVRAWWAAQGPKPARRLRIGLCWQGDGLVAAIPCAITRRRGVPVLEWAAKECSDYSDAIAGSDAGAALGQAWRALVQSGGFHVLYLGHIRPGAVAELLTEAGRGLPCTLRPSAWGEQTLQASSGGLSGEAWFRGLSKKARNNHRRGRRLLEQSGAVSVRVGDGADAPEAVERLIALKRHWLAANRQRNVLLDDDARILRGLMAYLRDRGALQVLSLHCGDEVVAGLVSIVDESEAAAFLTAFDPRFDRASPGTIALAELIMRSFDSGRRRVDFLCGAEAYKFKFANESTPLAAFVGARTAFGRAALQVWERLDGWRAPPQPVGEAGIGWPGPFRGKTPLSGAARQLGMTAGSSEVGRIGNHRFGREGRAAEVGRRFAAAAQTELVEDAVDVVLDGRVGDGEAAGDLLVGLAVGEKLDHVEFAPGQLLDPGLRPGEAGPAGEMAEQQAGQAVGIDDLAVGDAEDRGDDAVGRRFGLDVAGDADAGPGKEVLVAIVEGEHCDAGHGMDDAECGNEADPVACLGGDDHQRR